MIGHSTTLASSFNISTHIFHKNTQVYAINVFKYQLDAHPKLVTRKVALNSGPALGRYNLYVKQQNCIKNYHKMKCSGEYSKFQRSPHRKSERPGQSPASQSTANLSSVVCLALSSFPVTLPLPIFHLARSRHLSAFVFIKEFPQVFQVFSCLPVALLPCVLPSLGSMCSSLSICFLHSCLNICCFAPFLVPFRQPDPKTQLAAGMVD